jgi:hypothetical protein
MDMGPTRQAVTAVAAMQAAATRAAEAGAAAAAGIDHLGGHSKHFFHPHFPTTG